MTQAEAIETIQGSLLSGEIYSTDSEYCLQMSYGQEFCIFTKTQEVYIPGKGKCSLKPGDILYTRPCSEAIPLGGDSGVIRIVMQPDCVLIYNGDHPQPCWLDRCFVFHFVEGWEPALDFFKCYNRLSTLTDLKDGVLETIDKLITLLQNNEPYNEEVKLYESWKKIQFYMRTHLNDGLSGQEISDKLLLTVDYISRIVRINSGYNLSSYIKYLRMKFAHGLLQQTTMKIGEIAKLCGFSGPSFFTLNFRKYFKVTPSEVRNETEDQKQAHLRLLAERFIEDSYEELPLLKMAKNSTVKPSSYSDSNRRPIHFINLSKVERKIFFSTNEGHKSFFMSLGPLEKKEAFASEHTVWVVADVNDTQLYQTETCDSKAIVKIES